MRSIVAASLLLLLGCTGPSVRKATYPPDFRYITQNELRTAMGRMAHDVNRLDALLRRTDAPLAPEDNAQVVQLLGDLRQNAASLRAEGQQTNHALIDQQLDTFLADVDAAKAGAEHTPPNYFLAGTIAGSCLHCHRGGQ